MPPDDAIAANGGPVFGSANQTGFYITRNVFRNNNTSRPHYHTMDRWVTVIKGTWWGGTGKVFRPKEMKPMPAGSVMFHPGVLHPLRRQSGWRRNHRPDHGIWTRDDGAGRGRRKGQPDDQGRRRRRLRDDAAGEVELRSNDARSSQEQMSIALERALLTS